jgi:hypothetical protein
MVVRLRVLLSLLILALGLGACATVQPWEKDVLAEPRMQFRGELPSRHFLNHTMITIEEAEGGDGTAGGGCGCR